MSKFIIEGVIENAKERTSVYTPLIEAIVNSIQAIDKSKRTDGKITIKISRNNPDKLFEEDALGDITDIEISDNGIGFNETNRNSFDTLYSKLKVSEGGKGFGRFMFLKYFKTVKIESLFEESGKYNFRTFSCGRNYEIIENETLAESSKKDIKTTVYLAGLKESKLDKKAETLARKLLEKLLIYFINDKYNCPQISVIEEGKKAIILNDYLSNEKHAEIQEIKSESFTLENGEEENQNFQVKIFKVFYPNNQRSKITLTAHNREVTENLLHKYVPEFDSDFFEEFEGRNGEKTKKDYIIKAYVLGDYLDKNVSLERGAFNFPEKQRDALYPFSKNDIENETAKITKEIFQDEVKIRKNKKIEKIKNYVKEATWHKPYIDELDMDQIPYNLSNEDIELFLHKAKFQQLLEVKAATRKIIENPQDIDESAQELVKKISKAEMSDLAHYVALRKIIVGIFKKSLEMSAEGKYTSENAIHSIIFPTRSDSESTDYINHNLWIIDEKLNFTEYISSNKPLNGGKSERTDLLIYNNQIVFRGENEASNPITIFEFKKPSIDNFADQSATEDPVGQIIRYVNSIKEGKHKTPKGREISIGANTPFYGFVVCTLNKKVQDWLFKTKGFKVMPDGEGYFFYQENINLYLEVISWDKMLKDAEMRNKIFFNKLGIE